MVHWSIIQGGELLNVCLYDMIYIIYIYIHCGIDTKVTTCMLLQLNCAGCNGLCKMFTAPSGEFNDGSYAPEIGRVVQYQNNANCEWIIAPNVAAQITITFTRFITQRDYDKVTVSECESLEMLSCKNERKLATLSGTYDSSQVLTAGTGYMKVTFTTDASVTADGFAASWSSVCLICKPRNLYHIIAI
jgi:hypothetical protein